MGKDLEAGIGNSTLDASRHSQSFDCDVLHENFITPENWEVTFVFGKDRGVSVGFGNIQHSGFSTRRARSDLRSSESIQVKIR